MRLITVLFLTLFTACSVTPNIQPTQPWYETEARLDVKAVAHFDRTVEMVNASGLLLYSAYLPFTDTINYRDSHNIADAPAWHGAFMIGLSLQMVVEKGSEKTLTRLADGLLTYYAITDQKGLMGRSYLADYTGPRLSWMEDEEARPSKHWRQGNGGRWWRTGLAKGHLTYAVLGCGIPLILHDRGEITLSKRTRDKLTTALLPLVRRLVDGGFQYTGHDGNPTEFGDLRPDVAFGPDWPALKGLPNGFNRALVLAMLATCHGRDDALTRLYDEKALDWADGIGLSLELAGEVVDRIGHSKIGKPSYSDMQLFGVSAFAIMLHEERRDVLKGLHRGLHGLWEYMKHERNPLFTFPYYMVRPLEAQARIPEILDDLRGFPMPDTKTAWAFAKKDTDTIQPLVNRTTNSHYWKSSPFRKVISVGERGKHPKTGAINVYSGQDYLIAYWMGRYLHVIK